MPKKKKPNRKPNRNGGKGQFLPGNHASIGNRGPQRPDFLTQTLISQLNEVDAKTHSSVKHRLVDKLIKLGLAGDMLAIKEIFDRSEGKARQAVTIEGTVSHEHEFAGAREAFAHLVLGRINAIASRRANLKLVGSGDGLPPTQLEIPSKTGTGNT